MLKRCQDVETTLDPELCVPGWTIHLKEAVFLGISMKGTRSDLREAFGRFFANAKRSEGTGFPSREIYKKLNGDILGPTGAKSK